MNKKIKSPYPVFMSESTFSKFESMGTSDFSKYGFTFTVFFAGPLFFFLLKADGVAGEAWRDWRTSACVWPPR